MVRRQAIENLTFAIGRDNKRQAWVRQTLDLIETLLEDPQPEVRWWACYGAAQSGDPRYLPALHRLTDDQAMGGLGWTVAQEAEDAITIIGGGDPPDRHPHNADWDPWAALGERI